MPSSDRLLVLHPFGVTSPLDSTSTPQKAAFDQTGNHLSDAGRKPTGRLVIFELPVAPD
jgi:hypothetical protein